MLTQQEHTCACTHAMPTRKNTINCDKNVFGRGGHLSIPSYQNPPACKSTRLFQKYYMLNTLAINLKLRSLHLGLAECRRMRHGILWSTKLVRCKLQDGSKEVAYGDNDIKRLIRDTLIFLKQLWCYIIQHYWWHLTVILKSAFHYKEWMLSNLYCTLRVQAMSLPVLGCFQNLSSVQNDHRVHAN